jgi:hypothetical protein
MMYECDDADRNLNQASIQNQSKGIGLWTHDFDKQKHDAEGKGPQHDEDNALDVVALMHLHGLYLISLGFTVLIFARSRCAPIISIYLAGWSTVVDLLGTHHL